MILSYFFFNDTATTEIYTLSLHDALPISYLPPDKQKFRSAAFTPDGLKVVAAAEQRLMVLDADSQEELAAVDLGEDRKSTRLNSSHSQISYAVFCLKKKRTD